MQPAPEPLTIPEGPIFENDTPPLAGLHGFGTNSGKRRISNVFKGLLRVGGEKKSARASRTKRARARI
jgi:hypothetical protein